MVVLLITLSTPTRVEVELGCVRLRLWLGCDNFQNLHELGTSEKYTCVNADCGAEILLPKISKHLFHRFVSL